MKSGVQHLKRNTNATYLPSSEMHETSHHSVSLRDDNIPDDCRDYNDVDERGDPCLSVPSMMMVGQSQQRVSMYNDEVEGWEEEPHPFRRSRFTTRRIKAPKTQLPSVPVPTTMLSEGPIDPFEVPSPKSNNSADGHDERYVEGYWHCLR
jgi:hypothetical protein